MLDLVIVQECILLLLTALMSQDHLAQVVQKVDNAIHQTLVVQRLDNAMHWINQYPADKCRQKKPSYPLDGDLSSGQHYCTFQ